MDNYGLTACLYYKLTYEPIGSGEIKMKCVISQRKGEKGLMSRVKREIQADIALDEHQDLLETCSLIGAFLLPFFDIH